MRKLIAVLLPVALAAIPLSGCGGSSVKSVVPSSAGRTQRPSSGTRHALNYVNQDTGGGDGGAYDGVCTAAMSQCPIMVTYDPGPGFVGADPGPGEVAIKFGIPDGPCAQVDGSSSLPIGTTLGQATNTANGQTTTRSVIDVNTLSSLAFLGTLADGSAVGINYQPVGWIYLDNNGSLWFQYDASAQWSFAINANINAYFGVTLVPPAGKNATFIGPPPKITPINNHLQTTACWSKGRGLVPGTQTAPPGTGNA